MLWKSMRSTDNTGVRFRSPVVPEGEDSRSTIELPGLVLLETHLLPYTRNAKFTDVYGSEKKCHSRPIFALSAYCTHLNSLLAMLLQIAQLSRPPGFGRSLVR